RTSSVGVYYFCVTHPSRRPGLLFVRLACGQRDSVVRRLGAIFAFSAASIHPSCPLRQPRSVCCNGTAQNPISPLVRFSGPLRPPNSTHIKSLQYCSSPRRWSLVRLEPLPR